MPVSIDTLTTQEGVDYSTSRSTQGVSPAGNSPDTYQIVVTPSMQTSPASPVGGISTTSCDRAGAGNPIDISIPDDSQLLPGQVFTKVWLLQNVGTCTWTKDYKVALFSGESMGAQISVSLPGNVPPGQSVEISLDMVAPQTPGEYQSNWKLRNPSNEWFGIGPDGSAPFWVRIVIVGFPITVTGSAPPTIENTP